MSRLFIICLLIIFSSVHLHAQEKYWIYFNSKTGKVSTVNKEDSLVEQRNLPIYQAYIDQLSHLEITPVVKSKWLNAITAEIKENQIPALLNLPFIDRIELTRKIGSTHQYSEEDNYAKYSTVLKQVKADALIDRGLTGEGVDIGIIDGGFLDASSDAALGDIFYEDQYKLYKDFTGKYPNPFEGQKNHNDNHGTRVWRNIGGYDRDKDQYYGIATYANYFLAKSDRGDTEFRAEEDYWIAAIEWMDSLGIKIVNSSVGYSTGFDNPQEDYVPLDIDGRSPITRAAQIASTERGMLVIVSAGNDGNKDFKTLSVPADAKDVLTVGSCTSSNPKKMSFSSIGTNTINYVKPDVSCYSIGGTSFSAPVITGLAAAMKQFNPAATNLEIIDIIKKSSHLYPFPNNYLGYGVPNGEKILALLENPTEKVWISEELEVTGDLALFPSEGLSKITVFHKQNELLVIEQEEINSVDEEFIIARPAGTKRTTLSIKEKVYEIFWK